jgi:hypothetical protein
MQRPEEKDQKCKQLYTKHYTENKLNIEQHTKHRSELRCSKFDDYFNGIYPIELVNGHGMSVL